jgi:uncharacterized protein DUF4349
MNVVQSVFLILLLYLGFAASSCNKKKTSRFLDQQGPRAAVQLAQHALPEPERAGGGGGARSMGAPPLLLSPILAATAESKLIKTAKVRFQVKDTQKATSAITQLVSTHNGYIASQSVTTGSYSIENDLLIRVPSTSLDALLDGLLAQASYVESKVIEVKDVTEEFVDITARLKTQQEVENRYREILKQARKIEEILAVEKQLGEIRQEIEARQGRLRFLSHQVSYSTVQLTFAERLPYQRPPQAGFLSSLAESVKSGWRDFLDSVLGLVAVWPFLVALALLVFLFWRWRGHRNKRKLQVQS